MVTRECACTKPKMYPQNKQTQSCSIKSSLMQKKSLLLWSLNVAIRHICLIAVQAFMPQIKLKILSESAGIHLMKNNSGHQGLYVVWVLTVCIRHEYEQKPLILKFSIKSQETKNMYFSNAFKNASGIYSCGATFLKNINFFQIILDIFFILKKYPRKSIAYDCCQHETLKCL